MVEYGLQMFSVRDLASIDMRKALEQVAKLGYKYIEFARFYGHEATDVKAWLDEYGLVCPLTHTALDQLAPETIKKTIEYHKIIGADKIIIPNMKLVDKDTLDLQMMRINYAEKILSENGIKLGYHNHSGEFFPNNSGQVALNEILSRTNIELEVDIFWVHNFGIDVVEFLEQHKDRIHVIHLRDGFISPIENRNFKMWNKGYVGKALGEGEAPIKAVRQWALDNNVMMVVESGGMEPTGMEEVGRCIKYLRSLD